MTVMNRIRATVAKRVAYSQIKHELENMPLATAIDLGLFREDARQTAQRAVYG